MLFPPQSLVKAIMNDLLSEREVGVKRFSIRPIVYFNPLNQVNYISSWGHVLSI